MTIQLLPKSFLSPESNRLRCSVERHSECAAEPSQIAPADPTEASLLPLWLSAEEAEALLELCTHSRVSAGHHEEALFANLGDLIRGFR